MSYLVIVSINGRQFEGSTFRKSGDCSQSPVAAITLFKNLR